MVSYIVTKIDISGGMFFYQHQYKFFITMAITNEANQFPLV